MPRTAGRINERLKTESKALTLAAERAKEIGRLLVLFWLLSSTLTQEPKAPTPVLPYVVGEAMAAASSGRGLGGSELGISLLFSKQNENFQVHTSETCFKKSSYSEWQKST